MNEKIEEKEEEQEAEENKQKAPAEDIDNRPAPKKRLSKLDEARAENDRMEVNLKRREELIAREEQMASDKLLDGDTEAGSAPTKPKEETPAEYRDRVMAGDV